MKGMFFTLMLLVWLAATLMLLGLILIEGDIMCLNE